MGYVTGASAVPTDVQIVLDDSPRSRFLYAPVSMMRFYAIIPCTLPPVSLVCAMW